MLKELEIYDFGTYVEVITQIDAEQQYRMWFRGQSDYSWGLVPSVQRKDGMGKNYEQYISTNFMIHTMRLNPNAPQRYDRASWLTLMQHYGLPTRLLDWSESPLVALYFALSSDEDAKTDAAVWVLNPMRLNKKVGYAISNDLFVYIFQLFLPSLLQPVFSFSDFMLSRREKIDLIQIFTLA